jgi:hypothetical protein
MLLFDTDCDGVVIQPPAQVGDVRRPRLGGVTLREFGIAGTGKANGCRAIVVERGEGRSWGSTDALMVERLYTIEYEWSADLRDADASIITGCWFSECGNGLRLRECVYNCVTNCCFADNDGVGVALEGGTSSELAACILVRNERALEIDGASRVRVNGGCFETDGHGGGRNDLSLVRLRNGASAIVTGAVFHSEVQPFRVAVECDESSRADVHGCAISGAVDRLT